MKPTLTLSLQFADKTHRDQLPRHKVARWIRAALELEGEITGMPSSSASRPSNSSAAKCRATESSS